MSQSEDVTQGGDELRGHTARADDDARQRDLAMVLARLAWEAWGLTSASDRRRLRGVTMAQEPLLVNLRNTVATGEALRLALLDDLGRARLDERSAVRLELTMFYGRAFGQVAAALSRPLEPGARSVLVLSGAIHGRAAFNVWLDSETSAADVRHLDRMGVYWRQITRLVLDDRD